MDTVIQKPYRGLGMEGWIARWYASNTGEELQEFRTLAKSIAEGLPDGAAILEVAPGPGFLSIELARMQRFKVTGLDISHSFVKIARDNAARQGVEVDFRQGNASAMPFTDGLFDRIVCRAAFKNFTQPVEALQEMHRVLKPGGKAVVIDLRKDAPLPAINSYIKNARVSLPSALFMKWTFRLMLLKRAYAKTQMEQFVARSGFPRFEIEETDISFRLSLEK